MKTPAEIARLLKGFYDTNISALQGVMDKLPENMRADLQRLKDDLNRQLTGLPPIEQAPAASEAAGAMDYFVRCISHMQEYAGSLMERLQNLSNSLRDRNAAYQGLEQKLEKGELVTKERATELADLARKEGVSSVMPQIIDMRKRQVELAGLPEAPASVLDQEADKFNAAFTAAKDNVTKLGERGFKPGGKGAGLVKEMAWLGATEFAGKLESYADILGTKAPVADPLLGGGNANPNPAAPGEASKPALMAMA